jgi:tRNA pseudouridine55 synthase
VRRLTGIDRVGHAGTLDPLACGVLVVAIGAATRLIRFVQRMPKSYRGVFLLGRSSPTEDVEGEVAVLENAPRPTLDEIVAAAGLLVGRIQQRPPAFSALKVQGRRAYKLARAGRLVELKAREVTVHRLAVVSYAYPELVLEIECGGGTYVRSLGRDLAESLGAAAVMSALERTAIGGFRLADAVDPCQLTPESCAARVLPLVRAVEMLPKVVLSAEEIARIHHGLTISREVLPPAAEIAAVDATGRLAAILGPIDGGRLRTLCNLPIEAASGLQ